MRSLFGSSRFHAVLTFVVLSLCVGLYAQGAGELSGLVTDATGAVVSGVEVKLTNSATGEVRTTVTTAAGIYSFPALADRGHLHVGSGLERFQDRAKCRMSWSVWERSLRAT